MGSVLRFAALPVLWMRAVSQSTCRLGEACGTLDMDSVSMLQKAPVGILIGAPSPSTHVVEGSPGKIYIVRHAERDCDSCCLNATGWARAGNLSSFFLSEELFGPRPKKVFAYNYPDVSTCERCLQTALPTLTALQQDGVHDFPRPGSWCLPDKDGNPGYCPEGTEMADKEAADAMKAALTETSGGPVLAVWESWNTQWLMGQLTGGKEAPEWPYGNCEREYNNMYQVDFRWTGHEWEYTSYANLTEGMPCLAQRLDATASAAGLPWPPPTNRYAHFD